MKIIRTAVMAAFVSTVVCSLSPALAKDSKSKTYIIVNEEFGIPVFPYDITDRPYEILGEVKAGVRKATIFSKEASQEKIYRELWERGEKLGADAIINAKYGDSHVTAFSWGSTGATGTAIRFKPAAPVAAVPAASVAADPASVPQEAVAPAAE